MKRKSIVLPVIIGTGILYLTGCGNDMEEVEIDIAVIWHRRTDCCD